MVKVTGPLGGFDASGSLAGSIVFSKWKGRNYVRRLVKPSNPKSGAQVGVRAMFKFLAQQWATNGATPQASWNSLADATTITPFNAYMATNQKTWGNFETPTQTYPAAKSDTPHAIDTFTAVAGVRQITITVNTDEADEVAWGIIIFKSTTTGFTPGISNAIAVIKAEDSTDVTYVDTPLEADTYYYDCKPFSLDGNVGALKGEISATVT